MTTSPAELIASQIASKGGGFYVILIRSDKNNLDSAIADAAVYLKLKPVELKCVIDASQPLPVARLSTSEEAASVEANLRALGIESLIVEHADLQMDLAAKRVRALEMMDELLSASIVASPEKPSANWRDVVLLVFGRLIVNRVEAEHRRKRGRNQPVDTRELSSDESVLDVYFKTAAAPWRITATNFDFSCLGVAMAATAHQNFAALITSLRERAPGAEFDNSYAQARGALASIWPIEPQTRTGEWRRSGAGKFDMATVTTTDNEDQFTRYSRLRRWLKLRELESRR